MAVHGPAENNLRGAPRKVKPKTTGRADGGIGARAARAARGALSRMADAVAMWRRGAFPHAGGGGPAVLAIHGLALGGAGKTPLAIELAGMLAVRAPGRVALGTRSVAVVADEIEMIARAGPPFALIADDDPAAIIRHATEAGCTHVVLDDPSLSRRAPAHVRVVCLAREDAFDMPVFPAGPRRPGSVRVEEADFAALYDDAAPPVDRALPALLVRTMPARLADLPGATDAPPPGSRAYLLCAIARPERVSDTLAAGDWPVAGATFLPDHHRLDAGVRTRAESAARAAGADRVVVTPKDAARLPIGFGGERMRWSVIRHRIRVAGAVDRLVETLDSRAGTIDPTPPAARR